MVSVIFASQAQTNFHTIHGYRVHGNRSKFEISLLFPQQNWENKFGSTDSQFLFDSGLYTHKLHAPCSHAPCSRSHGSVVVCYCKRHADFVVVGREGFQAIEVYDEILS